MTRVIVLTSQINQFYLNQREKKKNDSKQTKIKNKSDDDNQEKKLLYRSRKTILFNFQPIKYGMMKNGKKMT